jgi:hypothetical protein
LSKGYSKGVYGSNVNVGAPWLGCSWWAVLPDWFLQLVGMALIGFGIYDSSVYWRLILKNHPVGHPRLRTGVVLVLAFYFFVGITLILLG